MFLHVIKKFDLYSITKKAPIINIGAFGSSVGFVIQF